MSENSAEFRLQVLAAVSEEIERLIICSSNAELALENIVLPPSLSEADLFALQGLDRLTQGLSDVKSLLNFLSSENFSPDSRNFDRISQTIKLGAIRERLFAAPPQTGRALDQGHVDLF
jgi:hypothetical protein